MGQFKFVLWLAYWYLQSETFEFEWDSGNSTKSSTKHGITSDIVGPTRTGTFISVVFTLREGRVRPISSRPANRKEKNLYEEIRKTLERIR